MKRISILAKMLIGITVPVIVVLVIAGVLIASAVGRVVEQQSRAQLESESRAAAHQVSEFFSRYMTGVQMLASGREVELIIEDTHGSARLNGNERFSDVKITLDKAAAADTQNILASWIGDFESSQITQSDGYNSDIGWDITGRPWYAVKQSGKPLLTAPYVDASTGQMIVSAAAPVFDNESSQIIGAAGFDIRLSQLDSIMDAYTIGEQGLLVLCAWNGTVIYHPDSSLVQRQFADLDFSDSVKQAVAEGAVGTLDYEMNGQQYSGMVEKVGDTGWTVLSGIPQAEILATYYSVISTIVIIFSLGLVLLIAMISFIALGISRPLKKLSGIADAIAAGNLDVTVDIKSRDETGLVAQAMSKTVDRLKDYIDYIDEIASVLGQIADNNLVFDLQHDYAGDFSRVKQALLKIRSTLSATIQRIAKSSDQVSAGAEQLSCGAQALSQGATEQASAVEQLAATINEISAQVRQNALDAKDANGHVGGVSSDLEGCNNQMHQLEQAMGDIEKRAGEIGNIIKTIEDIAFQTNILALNAAVEAARAGAAGKGFAVVADEVRNLASKSAQAAQSTTALIEGTIHSVANGTQMARDAAQSLARVVDSAKLVTNAIGKISDASSKQATSISQVSLGVEQISAVVQTNSATAEQSAASSEELSNEAQILKRLVSQFRLEQRQTANDGQGRLPAPSSGGLT